MGQSHDLKNVGLKNPKQSHVFLGFFNKCQGWIGRYNIVSLLQCHVGMKLFLGISINHVLKPPQMPDLAQSRPSPKFGSKAQKEFYLPSCPPPIILLSPSLIPVLSVTWTTCTTSNLGGAAKSFSTS